jgi:predicted MPP superfamily phosphohydrolase
MQKALKKESKQHIISYSGFILAISLTTGMLFGTLAGSRQLKVTQVELTFQNLPLAFNNFQIVQLSDFHLGGMLKPERILTKTKQKLDDFDTDLILFTGNLVNNFANEISGLESELKDITSLAESYSILGNHDYGDYADWESLGKKHANFEAILNAQKDAGFQLLNNEHLVLSRGTDSIYLAGVENWGHPPFPQYANLEAAINGIPSDAFTILMTHDPAHWEAKVAGKENIALTLSGHTHGLQWGIKFAGIPFSLAWLTRQNWGGLYKKNNSALYVNTGLGTVGMPWRLDMPGEITVITLKRSEID